MAAKTLLSSKLRVVYRIGVNDAGKDVNKAQRFALDPKATATEMQALSSALNDVIDFSIYETLSDDTSMIL